MNITIHCPLDQVVATTSKYCLKKFLARVDYFCYVRITLKDEWHSGTWADHVLIGTIHESDDWKWRWDLNIPYNTIVHIDKYMKGYFFVNDKM